MNVNGDHLSIAALRKLSTDVPPAGTQFDNALATGNVHVAQQTRTGTPQPDSLSCGQLAARKRFVRLVFDTSHGWHSLILTASGSLTHPQQDVYYDGLAFVRPAL